MDGVEGKGKIDCVSVKHNLTGAYYVRCRAKPASARQTRHERVLRTCTVVNWIRGMMYPAAVPGKIAHSHGARRRSSKFGQVNTSGRVLRKMPKQVPTPCCLQMDIICD